MGCFFFIDIFACALGLAEARRSETHSQLGAGVMCWIDTGLNGAGVIDVGP